MIYITSGKADGLDPGFLADLTGLLGPSPWHWWVTSGRRSLELQAQLRERHLAGGPLAAAPGESAHNYGLAVDVAPDLDSDPVNGLQPNWILKSAPWIWLKANTVPHPRLRSGWSFGDSGHIERFRWRRYI